MIVIKDARYRQATLSFSKSTTTTTVILTSGSSRLSLSSTCACMTDVWLTEKNHRMNHERHRCRYIFTADVISSNVLNIANCRDLLVFCSLSCNNVGQVVYARVPISPSSIIWYWSKAAMRDALRLGRKPQVWCIGGYASQILVIYSRGIRVQGKKVRAPPTFIYGTRNFYAASLASHRCCLLLQTSDVQWSICLFVRHVGEPCENG